MDHRRGQKSHPPASIVAGFGHGIQRLLSPVKMSGDLFFNFSFLGAMLTVQSYVADASHWMRFEVRDQILDQRAYSS